MKSVTILGSTGSIGTQALDVVRRNPDRFKVVGLSAAGANQELLVGQVREFLPPHVAIADEQAAADVKAKSAPFPGVEVIVGPDAAERSPRETETDLVLNALVGSAGLAPTLAALQSGKTLALANKESLVVGGELVTDLIKGEPERLLPGRFRARRAGDGAARRAQGGPQARRPHGVRRTVPRLDPQPSWRAPA